MTGALDRFAERGLMLGNVETMLAFSREQQLGKTANQDSLFGDLAGAAAELILQPVEPAPVEQKLLWEKELLGVYVSGHPLNQFAGELEKGTRVPIEYIKQSVATKAEIPLLQMKKEVCAIGIIETVKELLTKKGDRMAFVTLANQSDSIEMVAFPETYRTYHAQFIPGTCVAIKGKLSIRNDEPSILVDKIKLLGEQPAAATQVDAAPVQA